MVYICGRAEYHLPSGELANSAGVFSPALFGAAEITATLLVDGRACIYIMAPHMTSRLAIGAIRPGGAGIWYTQGTVTIGDSKKRTDPW